MCSSTINNFFVCLSSFSKCRETPQPTWHLLKPHNPIYETNVQDPTVKSIFFAKLILPTQWDYPEQLCLCNTAG